MRFAAGTWLLILPILGYAQSMELPSQGSVSRYRSTVQPAAFQEKKPSVEPSKELPVPKGTDPKKELPPPKPKDRLDTPLKGSEPPPPPKDSPAIQGTPSSKIPSALSLDEVLQSVEANYPLLRAIEQERQLAQARFLSAQGAFDTNFRMGSLNQPQYSEFESYRFNVGLDQAFMNSGVNFFSTYRGGYGDFPSYYGDRKTAAGGEGRFGFNIPFLRDNEIDRRRANLQQAAIGVQAAEPVIQRSRIDFLRAAAQAYWNWVTAGLTVEFAEELVSLARVRDKQFEELLKRGVTARIDRVQNQSTILDRNSILVSAQVRLQQTSVALSLYLRDEQGQPQLPSVARLPKLKRTEKGFIDLEAMRQLLPEPVEVDPKGFPKALEMAYEERPELQRIRLQRQNVEVERRWAINQTLPAVNGFVATSGDLGYTKTRTGPSRLDSSTLELGLELQLPIQRRDARGRVLATEAELRRIAQQEQFTMESIRAEVQSTFATLERAYELYRQASRRVVLAREVADVERQRFELGDSDVLRLTLLEQQEFQAILTEVTARFEYFRALADYQAALGVGGK